MAICLLGSDRVRSRYYLHQARRESAVRSRSVLDPLSEPMQRAVSLGEAAIPALVEALREEPLRQEAMRALYELYFPLNGLSEPTRNAKPVPYLERRQPYLPRFWPLIIDDSEDRQVRRAALQVLAFVGEIGGVEHRRDLVRIAERALEKELQVLALSALSEWRAREARDDVLAVYRDRNQPRGVRVAALSTSVDLSDQEAGHALLESALTDPDALVRFSAARGTLWSFHDPKGVGTLVGVLADGGPLEAGNAWSYLGEYTGKVFGADLVVPDGAREMTYERYTASFRTDVVGCRARLAALFGGGMAEERQRVVKLWQHWYDKYKGRLRWSSEQGRFLATRGQ